MNTFYTFFLTIVLITFLTGSDVKADTKNLQNNEPKWYEKPEITFPIFLGFGGLVAHLLNDKLANKQKEIVNTALYDFKKELTEERKVYFDKLEKLETITDEKLTELLKNQMHFNSKFENNKAYLNQIEIQVEKLNSKVAILDNRVDTIRKYLNGKDEHFSTQPRL